MKKILKALNTVGLFRRYAPISTQRLAKAMIASYFKFNEKYKIVRLKIAPGNLAQQTPDFPNPMGPY